jgi:hypothetical protein
LYVPPGHDSWVVRDEPYVSLHIVGSEDYERPDLCHAARRPCETTFPLPQSDR